MQIKRILIILFLIIFLGGVATADNTDDIFTVNLPGIDGAPDDSMDIPNGRPIYALLVSGFHQNRNLDMFHFYNFAKCLLEKGAYVHYSWWNNLLAPYMERPLHNVNSVPSFESNPGHDILGFVYKQWPLCLAVGGCYPNKALPAEDYQFQADATALLTAIRQHNPDAVIILVGHSMGGNAVVRLADNMPDDFDIDLLAPIDPVGNRTCVPNYERDEVSTLTATCNGAFNFTRWRATHEDWMTNTFGLYDPPRRAFTDNIKYLYHRWQQEFMPPFDYSCPQGPQSGSIPNPICLSGKQESEYLFDHPATQATSIHGGSTNVQSIVATSLYSGYDVYPRPPELWAENWGGGLDGHGEIVGFRGVDPYINPLQPESYPLALKAQGDWPRWQPGEPNGGPNAQDRIDHLKMWEADPDYLRDNGFAPMAPDLCMVSDDMCTILDTAVDFPDPTVNQPPVADAGPDRFVECSGPNGTPVTLDGSGSTDPNGDPLTFTWVGPFGTWTGETIYPDLPLGTHTITLTVDDGRGKTDSDTVDVTVIDSTPPSLSVSLSPNVLWPPNHKLVSIAASIQVSDTCDESPMVELVSIVSNEADNGIGDGNASDDIQGADFGTDDRAFSLRAERAGRRLGRIYTITYRAIDASGNVADGTAEVTVLHDRGKRRK